MKKKLLFILFCISIFNSFSQDLIAVQNGGTPNFYKDLSEAIKKSVAGDTIYIPANNYSINDTINKKIHLIGVGMDSKSNNAMGITKIASSSFVIPQLVLGDNADGGSITGIHFATNYYNGNPYANLVVSASSTVSNYLIQRCYFGSNVSGVFSNTLIKENIFRHRNNFNSETSNSLISNNVFCDRSNSFSNCLIKNNVFLTGSSFYKSINANNSVIVNNIFPSSGAKGNISNCTDRQNINFNGGNINNIELNEIFISYSQVNDILNFSANLKLKDNSPYKNTGTDGKDLGIYGGRFPWKDGSTPFNPQIIFKEIPGTTDENGKLKIRIEVEAQKN